MQIFNNLLSSTRKNRKMQLSHSIKHPGGKRSLLVYHFEEEQQEYQIRAFLKQIQNKKTQREIVTRRAPTQR